MIETWSTAAIFVKKLINFKNVSKIIAKLPLFTYVAI